MLWPSGVTSLCVEIDARVASRFGLYFRLELEISEVTRNTIQMTSARRCPDRAVDYGPLVWYLLGLPPIQGRAVEHIDPSFAARFVGLQVHYSEGSKQKSQHGKRLLIT